MKETWKLIRASLSDLNKALNKPLRFLILALITLAIFVGIVLCCVIYWQRGDMKRKDATISEQAKTITAKDMQITGLQTKIFDYLFNLNAKTERELEELKRRK